MHKLLLPCAIALAITGCGGSYDAKELKTANGGEFRPGAEYHEKDGGDLANGDVTRTVNGVKTLEFTVEDGRVEGTWIARDDEGNLTQELNLSAGEFTDTSTVYCSNAKGEKKPALTIEVASDVQTETTFDCASGLSVRQVVKVDAPGTPTHRRTTGEQKAWEIVDGKQVLRGIERYANDGSGKLDGLSEVYFSSGAIGQRTEYKAGDKQGRSEEYRLQDDGTSRLMTVNTYAKGQRDGEQTRYFGMPWPAETVSERQLYENDSETLVTTFTNGAARVYDRRLMDENWTLINQLKGKTLGYADQVADLQGLEYLLSNSKVDLNAPVDQHGDTPILVAAENTYDLLIKLGADATKLALNGQNRLQRCMTNELACSATHVLRLAAEPTAKSADLYGNTPLHLLCRSAKYMGFREGGSADQQLFAALAPLQDVNAKDYQGKTALHYCMKKNPQLIDGLVAAGADLDAADYAGITPMHALFLRGIDLEQIASSGYQVGWSLALVEQAGQLMSKSKFRFDAPFPGFEQGLKHVMIENGDAQSAMAADHFTPNAG